jgi:hypothetical protein
MLRLDTPPGHTAKRHCVATAVQLSGEGDDDKEERLVLHAFGVRDRPMQGVLRAVAVDFPMLISRYWVNLRTACRGFGESATGRCHALG